MPLTDGALIRKRAISVMTTIRTRLGLLFLTFTALISISVAATLWMARAQEKDALVINLAGRQRMLSQQITWMALLPADERDAAALSQAMKRFESNLFALRDGGVAERADGALALVPAAREEAVRLALDQALRLWDDFKAQVLALRGGSSSLLDSTTLEGVYLVQGAEATSAQELVASSLRLLAVLDAVVDAYEHSSQAKVVRLMWVQVGFLDLAVLTLLFGSLLVRAQILAPLQRLQAFARRIGEGELHLPMRLSLRNELGDLALAMEAMRQQLSAWREELEARVRQRTQELQAAFNFSQEMVSEHHLEHLLETIVEKCQALTSAQRSHLCLLNTQGNALSLAAFEGNGADAALGGVLLRPLDDLRQSQPVHLGLASEVIGSGKVVYRQDGCLDCAYLRSAGEVACVAAPLKFGHVTLGALCVVRGVEHPFSDEEVRALHLLANTAAIAIANARLLQREKLLAHQNAVQAERERMAAELHDHLAQTLSVLRLKVERLEQGMAQSLDLEGELTQIRAALETAYQQLRASLAGYKIASQEDEKLEAELRACIRAFETEVHTPIELKIFNPAALDVPQPIAAQVIHILSEALHNVRKHAQASLVQVLLDVHDGKACFSVQDNGCGFDLNQVNGGDHLGLLIMHTRAERCGGQLEVHSAIGEGTRVTLHIPLEKEP